MFSRKVACPIVTFQFLFLITFSHSSPWRHRISICKFSRRHKKVLNLHQIIRTLQLLSKLLGAKGKDTISCYDWNRSVLPAFSRTKKAFKSSIASGLRSELSLLGSSQNLLSKQRFAITFSSKYKRRQFQVSSIISIV